MSARRIFNWSARATLALAVASSAAVCQAASPEVEALLSQMRNAYQSVHSAKYSCTAHLQQGVFDVSYQYVSPMKVRLLVTSPDPNNTVHVVVATDGKTIAVKAGDKKTYEHTPFKADTFEGSLPGNLESLCFFDWKKQLSTTPGMNMEHSTFRILKNQTWNGENWTVLEETAAAQGVICSYYIDPKTHLIWRTIVKSSKAGNAQMQDCQIRELTLGPKIDDSVFTPG